jgi:hypothetical protein
MKAMAARRSPCAWIPKATRSTKTGKFPVGTMLDLEVRTPLTEVAPGGKTQRKAVGRSPHVKDEKAGPGTFYGFGAARRPATRSRAARPAIPATRNTRRRTPSSRNTIR